MPNYLVAPNLPLSTVVNLADTNQGTVQAIVLDDFAVSKVIGSVPIWYVDANTTLPPGQQNGRSPATAFKTTEQLSALLCPGGDIYTPQQNVTFNLAAGDYGRFYLRWAPHGFAQLTMVGTHTLGNTVVLNAVNAPSPGNGGTLGDMSGIPFTQRLRVLNGPAAGAVCFQTAGVPAPGNQVFVTCYRESDGSQPFPVVGNSVQGETITTTLQRLDLETVLVADFPGNGTFVLRDVSGVQVTRTRTAGALASFSECAFPVTATFLCDGPSLDFVNCQNTQPLTLTGGVFTFQGCVNRSTIQVLNGFARVLVQCATSAGNFTVSSVAGLGVRGRSDLVFVNDYFFEGGGGALACVTLGSGGNCTVHGRWGGIGISPYDRLCTMASGCWFFLQTGGTQISTQTVSGDFFITGHGSVARAAVPICYPRANCGVALLNDPAAAAQST